MKRVIGILLASLCGLTACTPATDQMETQTTADKAVKENEEHKVPPRPKLDRPLEPVLTGDPRADAISVAEHFVLYYPYMLKTGDTSYWEEHSSPECEFCQKVISTEKSRLDKNWIDGEIKILDQINGIVDENTQKYEIDFLVKRSGVVNHKDSREERIDDKEYRVVVALENASSWKITNFQLAKPESFSKE
ncbi:DUF6318 family protein [Arcanobacterium haemolyticum]